MWAKEKPTKPGWYWYREGDGQTIIEIGRYGDGILRTRMYQNRRGKYLYEEDIDDYTGEWSGPITIPE